MSAPSYSSANYDSAASKYKELLEQYTGEAGMKAASQSARNNAAADYEKSQAAAYRANLASGMNAGQAARLAQNTAASNYDNSYSTNYSNASAMNNAKLSGYNSLVSSAQKQDENQYNAKKDTYASNMGLVGNVLKAGADLGSAAIKK